MLENLMARGCQLAGVAACRDKGTQVCVKFCMSFFHIIHESRKSVKVS